MATDRLALRGRAAFWLVAVGVAACLPGCRLSDTDRPVNLIVISVDTLRADHMSLYGYPRETTPRLDAFAETAVTFDRARAPWPKTVPSMVSMFTSRPPHVTGVMFGSRDQYIENEELLLAEIAQQQGLKTGAVLSNAVLGSATNFGQGFDDYIETYKILQGPLGTRADTVTTAAARWLGGRTSDEPFFLWVHYVDPHATYEPPSEYAQPFFEDELYDATLLRLNDDTNFNSGVAGRYWRRNGGQREHGWYVANYDGEVAYTDAEIGRLLDVIEARGLLSNSVVVFTADHGESLGDHDYFFEHGWYPYNATAWIPFVVYWPGVPEPGHRVTYPVGLINLVPTLVDLMGWQISEPVPFHGRSLVPVLWGERDRVDDYVVVEAGEGGLRQDEYLRAIEDGRWKLIHVPNESYQRGMQKMPYELYEVWTDPMETKNVVAEHPELVELMKGLLEQRLTDAAPVDLEAQQPNYSKEELENLRSLGYIR